MQSASVIISFSMCSPPLGLSKILFLIQHYIAVYIVVLIFQWFNQFNCANLIDDERNLYFSDNRESLFFFQDTPAEY